MSPFYGVALDGHFNVLHFIGFLLQGTNSAEIRELAAQGLGDLIDITDQKALRPFVVQITGALIRIIGDR